LRPRIDGDLYAVYMQGHWITYCFRQPCGWILDLYCFSADMIAMHTRNRNLSIRCFLWEEMQALYAIVSTVNWQRLLVAVLMHSLQKISDDTIEC